MKRTFQQLLSALGCSLAALAQMGSPRQPPKVGDVAPDFSLPSTRGGRIKLSQFRGKQNVVLAFVSAAFTGG